MLYVTCVSLTCPRRAIALRRAICDLIIHATVLNELVLAKYSEQDPEGQNLKLARLLCIMNRSTRNSIWAIAITLTSVLAIAGVLAAQEIIALDAPGEGTDSGQAAVHHTRYRLVEVGTHDALMAKKGHYSELYGIQAAAYR